MPPTELSVRVNEQAKLDAASGVKPAGGGFSAPPPSRFEARIVEWLCEPLLERIPASVHPNTISLWTHFIAWLTAASAVSSALLAQPYRSLALLAASVGMLLSMIGDCLDGMHARRTQQTSKLGEMMDHWLDAIIVPLVTIGASMALEMEPWVIAGVNLMVAMVYHAQLVLYHHTGKFIHPEPASGVEGQFGVSVGYVGMAALFYFVQRQAQWLDVALIALGALAMIVEMKCSGFYYTKPGFRMDRHLVFVGLGAGLCGLYLLDIINVYAFLLALIFTSFRISGTYVLYTIIKKPYDGNDYGIAGFIVAIAAAHYGLPGVALAGLPLPSVLAYVACAYMFGRNMIDFARHYETLRPRPRSAA
jgi:phosphatidylglycerophosphate synthase